MFLYVNEYFFSLLQLSVDADGMESNNVTVIVHISPVHNHPSVIDTDGNSTVFTEEMVAVDIVGQNAVIRDQDQFPDHVLISEVQVRMVNASSGEVSHSCYIT